MVSITLEFLAKLAGEETQQMGRYCRRWGIYPSEQSGAVQTYSLREVFASLVALVLHRQGINSIATIQKAVRYCLKGNVEDRAVMQGQQFMVATDQALQVASGAYIHARNLHNTPGVVIVDLAHILNRMMNHEQIGAEAIADG